MANDINVTIGLEDQGFKKAMKDINQEMKTLDQTIRTADQYIDQYGDSAELSATKVDSLARKNELLSNKMKLQNQQLETGENKLKEYRNALEKVDQSQADAKVKTEKLNQAIKTQESYNSKLRAEIKLTSTQLKTQGSSMQNVGTKAQQAGAKMQELGNKISQINRMQLGQSLISGGQQLMNMGMQLGRMFGNLVMKGSEYDSSLAQTNMLYKNQGELTRQAIDQQAELANKYGLTNLQMKQGATELSTYYKALGFADQAIADMLPSQTQLIADMMAFADVPFADALGDFKSALMGNHEAVDKYGISLGESTMNESSYAKELGKTVSQMTESEKVSARMNVMMEQSADYTGLAEEEAKSFTAQMKLLKSQVDEGAGAIMQRLLPTLEPLVEKLRDAVTGVVAWAEQNPQLTNTILMITGALAAFLVVAGGLAIVAGLLMILTTPIGLIVLGITALIAALVALWLNFDQVSKWCSEVWTSMCTTISSWIDTLKTWVTTKWNEMVTWVQTKTSEMITKVVEFFSNLPYKIGYWLGETLVKLNDWGNNMWNYLVENVPVWIENVVTFFSELPSKIWTWLLDVIAKVVEWGSDMADKAKKVGGDFIEFLGEELQKLPSKMWDWAVAAMNSFLDGLKSMWGAVTGFFSGLWDGLNSGKSNATANVKMSRQIETLYTGGGVSDVTSGLRLMTLGFEEPHLYSDYLSGDSSLSRQFNAEYNPVSGSVVKSTSNENDDVASTLSDIKQLLAAFLQTPKQEIKVDNMNIGNSTTEDNANLQML